LNRHYLEVAARAAIRNWVEAEGVLAAELREPIPITHDLLSRWLHRWNLARANANTLRPLLLAKLNDVVRPEFLRAPVDQLPSIVVETAIALEQARETKGKQISMMSKFAFSLRPEDVVPSDKWAHQGLGSGPIDLLETARPA